MTAEQKVTRKLSAILSADVKGYSRLMTDDEALTIKTLKEYRNIMSGIITQHSGRVVDAPGDNIMAEFASVVNAVQCAVEIQAALKSNNADIPYNKRLVFRIGINIGDVVQDGDSLYGEGVNIAARIEGLADPGGVCISRGAYDHIRNKLKLGYEYIGEHTVKNIKDPVRVYKILMEPEDAGKLIGEKSQHFLTKWLRLAIATIAILAGIIVWQFYYEKSPPVETASVENMAFPLPEKPSIAVLAFDNMTGDKEQNYFCEGLSEEIISALSSVPELFVIARNSTFSYKGKSVKVQQISEELGVQYVLEGSVRKSGERIRITAQLIDALNGHHLWSESYDRNIEDFFVVQEDIALKVITELQVKLIGREEIRLRAPCSENLKAYLTYLKAHDRFYRFTREDNAAARRLLEKAIDLDPGYACAYSMLGGTYRLDVYLGTTESPKQSFATAKKMFEKAIDLNPSLAGPRAVLASLYCQMGQYEQAIVEAEKALAISPDSVLANGEMGTVLYSSGRSKEAITFCKKAIRLDPFSTTYFRSLGMSYLLSSQNEQAIQVLKKLIDSKPAYLPAHLILAAAYSAAGLIEEANAAASVILKMAPKFTLEKYSKTWRLKNPADKELLISNLRKAGLPEKPLLPLPDKPSIAVLPFDNMSGDPEQEYFSDGITEDIITDLSKISSLKIISRNSTFAYKGKEIKIPLVAKELGVNYVLEGSIRKSGNDLRINAQLIDAVTDQHVWADRFDGKNENIFALQDKITEKIVSALAVKLSSSEQQVIAEKGTNNIAAHDTFLKGMSHMRKITPKDYVKAIEYFEKAVKLDPDYSDAYANLANIYMNALQIGKRFWDESGIDFPTARLLARHYVEKAMKKPTSRSYQVLARLELFKRNFSKAVDYAEHAVAISPNDADALYTLGRIMIYVGKLEEGIKYQKRSIMLDPLYKSTGGIGLAYFAMGDYEQAVKYIEKHLKDYPETYAIQGHLATAYAFLGNDVKAKEAFKDFFS